MSKNSAKKGMHPGESAWKAGHGNLSCVIVPNLLIGHIRKDCNFGSDTKNKIIWKVLIRFGQQKKQP